MGGHVDAMSGEPGPIHAVLFDVGGTLLDVSDHFGWSNLASRLGVEVDPEALAHAWRDGLREFDRPPPVPAPREFWQWVLGRAAGRPVPLRTAEQFAQEMTELPPVARLYSDVRRCLEGLKPLVKTVGVLSNSTSEESLRGLLADAGIVGRFQAILSSGTEGVRKPEAEFFLRGVRRLGAMASETLYVGDLAYTDAKAASLAGLYGVWLKRDGTGFGEDPPEITSLSEVPEFVRASRRVRSHG
ncbi:MAG: HAD family hydrolase [Thermoplasmata archaeon]|nr:HAD family hydrolase [Thermoplasmata archaeon]